MLSFYRTRRTRGSECQLDALCRAFHHWFAKRGVVGWRPQHGQLGAKGRPDITIAIFSSEWKFQDAAPSLSSHCALLHSLQEIFTSANTSKPIPRFQGMGGASSLGPCLRQLAPRCPCSSGARGHRTDSVRPGTDHNYDDSKHGPWEEAQPPFGSGPTC